MRIDKIRTLFMKEYDDVIKSKYVLSSLIFMPLIFVVFLPAMMFLPIVLDPDGFSTDQDLTSLLQFAFTDNWTSLTELQQYFVFMVEFSFAFFLLLPVMLPTIIAADSMSGEKERGTVEGIVSAPITETEIYLGKVAGSLIPSTAVVWFYSLIFVVIVNWASSNVLGYWYLPTFNFVLSVFILGPLLGFAVINLMIWLSSRIKTSRDTQQIAGVIVLPIFIIVLNSLFFALVYSEYVMVMTVLVLIVIDYFLADFGIRLLDRERWLKYAN